MKVRRMGTLSCLMDRIMAWNVRGLNTAKKQNEVKVVMLRHAVGLVELLEHKVKITKLGDLYIRIFPNWCFYSNSSYHKRGRILIAWNLSCFHVNIIAASSQFMLCYVEPVVGCVGFIVHSYMLLMIVLVGRSFGQI